MAQTSCIKGLEESDQKVKWELIHSEYIQQKYMILTAKAYKWLSKSKTQEEIVACTSTGAASSQFCSVFGLVGRGDACSSRTVHLQKDAFYLEFWKQHVNMKMMHHREYRPSFPNHFFGESRAFLSPPPLTCKSSPAFKLSFLCWGRHSNRHSRALFTGPVGPFWVWFRKR